MWFAEATERYEPVKAGSIDGTDDVPHDHAIVRALRAAYDPSKDPDIVGDAANTLFVGRLSFDTTEDTLHNFFSNYGCIKHLRLVRDIGKSRGYAFIEYEDERDHRYAFRSAHRSRIDGAQIIVDYERERQMPGWVPRRLGGGIGGRKESGQLRFGGRERPWRKPILLGQNTRGSYRGRGGGGRGFSDRNREGGYDHRGQQEQWDRERRGPESYERRGDGDRKRERDDVRGGDRWHDSHHYDGRERGRGRDRDGDRHDGKRSRYDP